MKKRLYLSLPMKANLLMIVIILVIAALLFAISNYYYWETVYTPHAHKLNQASIQTKELAPAANGVLRFLGSEQMSEILAAENTGDEMEIMKRMALTPSLSGLEDLPGQEGEGRTLLVDVMDVMMAFMTAWAAVLELSTGRGRSCNAGHEKPSLRRAASLFTLLD